MSGAECPYCGKTVEICHDDGYGLKEGEKFSEYCPECGHTFVYEMEFHIEYTCRKAECLNGGEHIYKLSSTYPRCFSMFRCEVCGEAYFEENKRKTGEDWDGLDAEIEKQVP